jgi:hypothetical protein
MDTAKYSCHEQSSKEKNPLVRTFEADAAIKRWNAELSGCGDVRQAYQLCN